MVRKYISKLKPDRSTWIEYDEKNAIELFDIAVNMGVATSAKTLQNVEFNE
jgi:lysozyme family protein